LLGVLWVACGHDDNGAQKAACNSITVGMSEAEVLKRMRAQHKRIELSGDQAGKHKLIFEDPRSTSAKPQFVFDSTTNTVEAVFCGE
jgi:hypothetical protein